MTIAFHTPVMPIVSGPDNKPPFYGHRTSNTISVSLLTYTNIMHTNTVQHKAYISRQPVTLFLICRFKTIKPKLSQLLPFAYSIKESIS